jgi:hypothetical protein
VTIRANGFDCKCDVCGRYLRVPAITEAKARELLAAHHWESGDLDLCKVCVIKRDAGDNGIFLLIEQARKRRAAETQPGG